MPELILDRKTGFLVNNIDEALDVVDHIKNINREDCKEWAASNFSQQRMVDAYLEVYKKILDK